MKIVNRKKNDREYFFTGEKYLADGDKRRARDYLRGRREGAIKIVREGRESVVRRKHEGATNCFVRDAVDDSAAQATG